MLISLWKFVNNQHTFSLSLAEYTSSDMILSNLGIYPKVSLLRQWENALVGRNSQLDNLSVHLTCVPWVSQVVWFCVSLY